MTSDETQAQAIELLQRLARTSTALMLKAHELNDGLDPATAATRAELLDVVTGMGEWSDALTETLAWMVRVILQNAKPQDEGN